MIETNKPGDQFDNEYSDITPQPKFDSDTNYLSNQNNSDTKRVHRNKKNREKYSDKWKDPLVIVTIILAVATFMLYWRATQDSKTAEEAGKASRRSADAAENTFREQKVNDSINRIKDSINYIIATSINAHRFHMDSTSLQAQINSIKEMRDEFEIHNRPFLEISGARVETFEIGKPLSILVTIRNLGNYPIQILNSKAVLATRVAPPDTSNSYKNSAAKNLTISDYISKESEGLLLAQENSPLNENRFNLVKNGYWWVYEFGEITYMNLVTHKKMKYRFMFKTNLVNRMSTIYSIN